MKKQILFSVLGGLILWIWQFVSFMAANLHKDSVAMAPNQEKIMQFLEKNIGKDGAYLLPQPDHVITDMQEAAEYEKSVQGKPWARIFYYESYDTNMNMNIIRGLLTNIVLIFLFSMILKMIPNRSLGQNLMVSLTTGLIIFINGIYTSHMWYPLFDLNIHLLDCLVEWAAIGILAKFIKF